MVETQQTLTEIHHQGLVVVYFLKPFVQATYNLEGDGYLITLAYDIIELFAMCSKVGEILSLSLGRQPTDREVSYVTPAVKYFCDRLQNPEDCGGKLVVLSAARPAQNGAKRARPPASQPQHGLE